MTRSLDLGCGPNPKNPFNADELFGVDIREDCEAGIKYADLAIDPIPFEDDSFEYVTAYDFLEHIPRVVYSPTRRNAFVEIMNEIHRVLKVGGLFLSFTPAYPHLAAFQDPTHVNAITEDTFQLYFDHINRWAAMYGFIGAFLPRIQEWRGQHLLAVLQKVPLPCVSVSSEKDTREKCSSEKPMSMLKIHEEHWSTFMDDSFRSSLYDSWWVPGTVNYWRHTRLLAPVLEVLSGLKQHSWLTIGDGAGMDAWRLLDAGFASVLATDLEDSVLKQTLASGRITAYQVENAEALSFADNSFDFILCKEALHHMSRPYMALYEFFRVARFGVVIIEAQDQWVDWPCRIDSTVPYYEGVGNYVYSFSTRELEKIAYGMNITGIATRKLVDVYIEKCEFAYCADGDPIWETTRTQVEEAMRAMKDGTVKENYVQGIFFKNTVTSEAFSMLAQQNPEWSFVRTDTNPHLNGQPA